MFVTM